MYERQFRQKQLQLQKADQAKKEKEQQKLHNELMNVTFKPQIASTNIPVKSSFYERNQKYSQAYKNRQKLYQNQDDKLAEEYTFKPQINPVSQYICDNKLKRTQDQNLHNQVLQTENISYQVDLLEKLRQTKKQAKIHNSVKLQKQTQQLYKQLEESQASINQSQVSTLYPTVDKREALKRQQSHVQIMCQPKRQQKQLQQSQTINLEAIKYNQLMNDDKNDEWLDKYYKDKDEIENRKIEQTQQLKNREMEQCTFQPQISEQSKMIAQGRPSLVESYSQFKQHHDQIVDQMYQAQLHKELKDCTFKPQLTENSDIIIEDSFNDRQEKLLAHQRQRRMLRDSTEPDDQEQLEAELTIINCNQFKHIPSPQDQTCLMLKDQQQIQQKLQSNSQQEMQYLSRLGGTDISVGMKNLNSINKTVKRFRTQREIEQWNKYYAE